MAVGRAHSLAFTAGLVLGSSVVLYPCKDQLGLRGAAAPCWGLKGIEISGMGTSVVLGVFAGVGV